MCSPTKATGTMAWTSWAASSRSETKKRERSMREGYVYNYYARQAKLSPKTVITIDGLTSFDNDIMRGRVYHTDERYAPFRDGGETGTLSLFTPVYHRNGGIEVPSERGRVNSAGTLESSNSSTMDDTASTVTGRTSSSGLGEGATKRKHKRVKINKS
jgi:hypothetical protein